MVRTIRPLSAIMIAAFGLVFHSCNKEEGRTVELDAAVKKAYSFQPGTYWIFKDNISGRYDSFYVTSNVRSYIETKDEKRERIAVLIYQHGPGSIDSLSEWTLLLDKGNQVQLFYIDPGHNGEYFKHYNYAPVFYPFATGSYRSQSSFDDTVNIAQIPVLTTNGKTFTATTALSFQNSYVRSTGFWQFRDTFHLNETEGLLKISLNHPPDSVYRNWSLERWHIVR